MSESSTKPNHVNPFDLMDLSLPGGIVRGASGHHIVVRVDVHDRVWYGLRYDRASVPDDERAGRAATWTLPPHVAASELRPLIGANTHLLGRVALALRRSTRAGDLDADGRAAHTELDRLLDALRG